MVELVAKVAAKERHDANVIGNEGFVLELGHECIVTLEDDDNDGANKSNDGSKLAERSLISQGSGVKVLNLDSASETDMRDEQGDPDESAIKRDQRREVSEDRQSRARDTDVRECQERHTGE